MRITRRQRLQFTGRSYFPVNQGRGAPGVIENEPARHSMEQSHPLLISMRHLSAYPMIALVVAVASFAVSVA